MSSGRVGPVQSRGRRARACSPGARRSAPPSWRGAIYSPRNCDAARQLYRVTAGLESMIVGEAEIQGQVKRAYEAAMRAGCTGPLSNRLFAAALTTGKRVRSETGIGSCRVSVPSVAVDLAQGVLGGLEERHVVILGAGETSELTARALAEQGVGTIFVANRHADRALSLAQRFGGSVVGTRRTARTARCRPTSWCPRPPRPTRSSAARSSSW